MPTRQQHLASLPAQFKTAYMALCSRCIGVPFSRRELFCRAIWGRRACLGQVRLVDEMSSRAQ